MEPSPTKMFNFFRNRQSFMVGASWSHEPSWPTRMTHIYLGFWALTIITGDRSF